MKPKSKYIFKPLSLSNTDLPSALHQIFHPITKTARTHRSCADLHFVSSSCSDEEKETVSTSRKSSKYYETIHSIIPENSPRLLQCFRNIQSFREDPSQLLRTKMKQSISLNNLHDDESRGLVSHFSLFECFWRMGGAQPN